MTNDGTTWFIATIGHGGIGAHGISKEGYATRMTGATLEETKAHVPLVLDLRTIPFDELAVLSMNGPLIDPKLPANSHAPLWAPVTPFDPTPEPGRDPRLGSAHSFSNVSWDVYARMAVAFGAEIVQGTIPPAQESAERA